MNRGEKNPNKELYKQLRTLSCRQLWEEEVPHFDRAAPEERIARVSLIRAVGVVFSESGTDAQKQTARAWLQHLLHDPSEKIRRYAMAALPKLGAGPQEEAELLSLLRKTTVEREKKFLGEALTKIGGSEALQIIGQSPGDALSPALQKVRANVARSENPSSIRMEHALTDFAGLRIHLRGRNGLEQIVQQEIEETMGRHGRFRIMEVRSGLVAVTPAAAFSLADIFALRCFGSIGFVLGNVDARDNTESVEALATVITSPRTLRILDTFTEGSIRYRLEFIGRGHQRGAVRQVAERAYALSPKVLNDARNAPWAIDVHPGGGKSSVELRPRLSPDPRLSYRRRDVPAASHPPLAACMARLAGSMQHAVVWDPFCGSGLELIERALLGGVNKLYGTDLSAEAIAITKENFTAAKLAAADAEFACCDFRDFRRIKGLERNAVDLIITNPPMGKRVPIHNLRQLIEDLLAAAANVLKPGGRLIFANPLRMETSERSLKLESRRVVDFGGFDCRLEVYRKLAH